MTQTVYKEIFAALGDKFSASQRLKVHNKMHLLAQKVNFAYVFFRKHSESNQMYISSVPDVRPN